MSTGVCLLNDLLSATDTVAAEDLQDYLRAVVHLLAAQGITYAVVAERPLTIWRSSLSRDLDHLIGIVNSTLPEVRWIDAATWKQQKAPLVAYARSRHLVAWRSCKTPHEHDALLVALWAQGVLIPAKSP
jgi:hypothetical protein